MPKRLQGVLPIVQTPFDNDDIDFATLAKEVEWGLAQGIDGLGTGMVSELLKLTAGERQSLAEHLVQYAADRGPVFMGVGAESSRQCARIRPRRRACRLRRGNGHAADQRASQRSRIDCLFSHAGRWRGPAADRAGCVRLRGPIDTNASLHRAIGSLWSGKDPLQAGSLAGRPEPLVLSRRNRRSGADFRRLRRHFLD